MNLTRRGRSGSHNRSLSKANMDKKVQKKNKKGTHRREGKHRNRKEGMGKGGCWRKGCKVTSIRRVSCFEFFMEGVNTKELVRMWCTNDVSFVFLSSNRRSGYQGGARRLKIALELGKKWGGRKQTRESKGPLPPPQEGGVSLSPITLVCDPKGFIKGLHNQRPSGNVYWGVIQNI